MSEWSPMTTAPMDGTEFVWLQRITILAVGKPNSYRWEARTMRRHWMSDERGLPREGKGYWMAKFGSVPDFAALGWWMPLPQSGEGG
jgi:hypothetical protein